MEYPPIRHAAQEEVEDAAQMASRIIARQALLEQPMQGQGVELVLEIVAMIQHGLLQLGRAIIGHLIPQVIGLVIQQIPAPLPLKDQVDKALEHPLYRLEAEHLGASRQGIMPGH